MKERRFRLIIFIVVLSFGKSPKSKRICTPHQENILEHLKNSKGTYGAAADFCPLNFLVGTLHLGLHGQEQHFDVKGKPDGCQFQTCGNNQALGKKCEDGVAIIKERKENLLMRVLLKRTRALARVNSLKPHCVSGNGIPHT